MTQHQCRSQRVHLKYGLQRLRLDRAEAFFRLDPVTMEQTGRVDDQLIRRFACQFGGGAGNRFGSFKVERGERTAPQRANAGTARILFQPLAKGCAEGATGADHQRAITVAERGQGQCAVHSLTPAPWRRKNNVTCPTSTPNLDMLVRLINVSSSIKYIQSSMLIS
ncbi:hypothetical protein D3C81_1571000 [compost metagenome]